MKSVSSILLMSISLLILQSCGKKNTVEIGSPGYRTESGPFKPSNTEEDAQAPDEDEVSTSDLGPGDPCYKFIRHEIVRPVATCTEVEVGRLKRIYKQVVESGKLCLLKKSFPNGISLYTLVGEITEKRRELPAKKHKIDIFGQSILKDQFLKFKMKADEISFVKYNLDKNSVTVRQLSKRLRKRKRYFRMSCRPIAEINE